MLQLFWILIVAGVALLAAKFSDWLPQIVGGALVLIGAGWVLTSVLWPSAPDRRCPKCRRRGLVKIRRGEPGVRCELCGFRDETLHVAYLDDW
jgi:hypothetical protein